MSGVDLIASALSLTDDDLQRFIFECWRNDACPRCRLRKWSSGMDGLRTVMLPIVKDDVQAYAGMLPAIWVSCDNCGHIELIESMKVAAWKDGRRYPGARPVLRVAVDNTDRRSSLSRASGDSPSEVQPGQRPA